MPPAYVKPYAKRRRVGCITGYTLAATLVRDIRGRRERSRPQALGEFKEIDMEFRQLLVLSAVMLTMTGGPSYGQGGKEPYVRVAEIEIDPVQLEAYQAAVKEQIEAALRIEPGVLALYSVADKENPAHITVFEIYTDVEAYKTHLETAHFKKYKTATQDIVKSLKLRETVPILLGVKRR
jgi:quinol monooxygenase YgiN